MLGYPTFGAQDLTHACLKKTVGFVFIASDREGKFKKTCFRLSLTDLDQYKGQKV